jgi:hypothetical protein
VNSQQQEPIFRSIEGSIAGFGGLVNHLFEIDV